MAGYTRLLDRITRMKRDVRAVEEEALAFRRAAMNAGVPEEMIRAAEDERRANAIS